MISEVSMKKVVFARFLTSLVLFSCSGESVEVDSVNQQTILVYMPWSGSESHSGLYPNFKQNLDSIESAIKNRKGLGKTRALIFISESANTSKLYEIRYEENACKRELLKTYTGRDYTTAEGIARLAVEFVLDGFQIGLGHDDIRVQNKKVFPLTALGTVVARWTWAAVGLVVVMQLQFVGIFLADCVAFLRRAVFHHHDFKVLYGLVAKALQQLVDFLRSVVDGYDD